MVILFGTHPKYIEHDTGSLHPESPERLTAVRRGIDISSIKDEIEIFEPQPATIEEISRVHDVSYLDALRRFCLMGGGTLDPDTTASIGSWEAMLLAAGAGLDAARRMRAGKADAAFLAVRPPGHHAVRDRAMGFCLANNIAVLAADLVAQGEKVLIFDFDAHHGNGTQEMFFDSASVLYVSSHQYPLYPGTGRAREVGIGSGTGYTLNLPFPADTTGPTFREALDRMVAPVVEAFLPTWTLISAGFDSHRRDPLTEMGLTSADFSDLTLWVRQMAPSAKVVAFLEGGYDFAALEHSTASTLAALAGVSLKPEPNSDGPINFEMIKAMEESRKRALSD